MTSARVRMILGVLTLVGLTVGLYLGLVWAPPDAYQGQVQRIMYVHVPSAWVAYLAFLVVFISSILYLWRGNPAFDQVAHASAEVGVVFTGLAILAGSIWGKPTWGVWWTWDARLTTTAILLLIYIGYLMLRSFVEDQSRGARYAAVLGIVGFLDIPIIHKSVEWWRTLHQPPSVMRPEGSAVAPPMLFTLLVSVAAFTLLYLYLLSQRLHLEHLDAEILERNREG
ncbi:MAG: heme ABC transporter permease CcmC [Candidatus Methylomirabilales bacterium]